MPFPYKPPTPDDALAEPLIGDAPDVAALPTLAALAASAARVTVTVYCVVTVTVV